MRDVWFYIAVGAYIVGALILMAGAAYYGF